MLTEIDSKVLDFKTLFDPFMFYSFFRSALEEGLCMLQTEISGKFVKYILLVLAISFFVTSAVRISLPSVFCILDNLLIQVYYRSGRDPAPLIGLSVWAGITNFNCISAYTVRNTIIVQFITPLFLNFADPPLWMGKIGQDQNGLHGLHDENLINVGPTFFKFIFK